MINKYVEVNMSYPTLKEAERLLSEANEMNEGPWYQHCINAGLASKYIAEKCPNMDADKAQILGMLHDIGRRFGKTNFKHTIDGYNFCMEQGYDDVAKVCLTHSLPTKNIKEYFGGIDCCDDEYEFSERFIKSIEYDDYDKLIQLCDALSLPSGFCLMEKRMVDVALRHGIHDYVVDKWKVTFQIKEYFENMMNTSIYTILPNVMENTFNQ